MSPLCKRPELDAPITRDFEQMAYSLAVAEAQDAAVSAQEYVAYVQERLVLPGLQALVCADRFTWPCVDALEIIACESGGDPNAFNPSGSYGWFQIYYPSHAWRVGPDPSRLFDPVFNTEVAHDIYQDNAGWGAWACPARP